MLKNLTTIAKLLFLQPMNILHFPVYVYIDVNIRMFYIYIFVNDCAYVYRHMDIIYIKYFNIFIFRRWVIQNKLYMSILSLNHFHFKLLIIDINP